MTPEQVEGKVIELVHRQPFLPFVVEMTDGRTIEVPHPRLSINGGGAGYIDADGALADIEFKDVRFLRLMPVGAVA